MASKPRSEAIDTPQPARNGEQLDAVRLTEYLREPLGLSESLEIQQFTKGYSNLTYLLRSGAREWVLRRPPFGAAIKSAHDMGREYAILSRLWKVYPKAPRALLLCEDTGVLGAPFYVMERVEGVVLRSSSPPGVFLGVDVMSGLSRQFVIELADIHATNHAAAGLADLGRPEGYRARQVEGWIRRYQVARTDDVPALEQSAAWLRANLEPESDAALIHNDFKYDNLVLDPLDLTSIRAVLDWEMATIGDPLFDLGTSLAYWVEADDSPEWQAHQFGPTMLPGNFRRDELLAAYSEASGRVVENPAYLYAFGLFKLAVIVQQIYARFAAGLTHDERFARLKNVVALCGGQAMRAIGAGRISGLG